MTPPEEEFMVMEKENTPVDVSAKHMQRALFEETVAVDNTVWPSIYHMPSTRLL